jgi:hypothetical protein
MMAFENLCFRKVVQPIAQITTGARRPSRHNELSRLAGQQFHVSDRALLELLKALGTQTGARLACSVVDQRRHDPIHSLSVGPRRPATSGANVLSDSARFVPESGDFLDQDTNRYFSILFSLGPAAKRTRLVLASLGNQFVHEY